MTRFRTATAYTPPRSSKPFEKMILELRQCRLQWCAPRHLFGLDQVIEIGPMSGKSNVLFWRRSTAFRGRCYRHAHL